MHADNATPRTHMTCEQNWLRYTHTHARANANTDTHRVCVCVSVFVYECVRVHQHMRIKIPTHTYVCTDIGIHPSCHFVPHTRTPRLGSLDHDMSLSCHEVAELQHRCTDPSYVLISLGFQFRVSCDYLIFVGAFPKKWEIF